MYMYVDIVPGWPIFCLTDFVQGLSYKGVQDRQVSVVNFFSYTCIFIFFLSLLLVWVTLSFVIKIIIIINK